MSRFHQFSFFVRNDLTREIATFIGDGKTLEQAWEDGVEGLGKTLAVRLPNGVNCFRVKADFEGEEAADTEPA